VIARPLLPPEQAQALLERVLHEHLSEHVDWLAIADLERTLSIELAELTDDTDRAIEIAKQLIDAAWLQLSSDPRRYAVFGADCKLCEAERSGAG